MIQMSVRPRRNRGWIDLPLGWWMNGAKTGKTRRLEEVFLHHNVPGYLTWGSSLVHGIA